MPRFRLSCVFFISLFFLTILISGCSNTEELNETPAAASPKSPIYGGKYRIPLAQNPATLDPAHIQGIAAGSVIHQLFDGLVKFDSYLSILPALAETWEIKEKGKVYRFKLKDNAVFHNHEPVTSEDVRFSIQRLLRVEPPSDVLPHLLKIVGADTYRKGSNENLTGIDIKDKKNFSIRLLEPHVPFLTVLGMHQTSILPEKSVKQLGERFGNQPVGSGPFRFISWDNKKAIQLKRFKDYYNGPAYLDEILFRIYPGGQNQVVLNDFKNKQLEEITAYGNAQEELAELKEELQWYHRPSLSLFFYGINITHPHLSDPGLRKALSKAVDRNALVNNVYGGQYQVAETILPPGMPGHRPSPPEENNAPALEQIVWEQNRDNTDRQRQNLELEIVSSGKSPRVEKEMALFQKFWAPLGIVIRPKYITDWKEFQSYLKSGITQIYRLSWHADMPDPDSFLSSLFLSDASHNFMKLKDKNIDSMLSDARRMVDPIKRAEMYRKIEVDILALNPIIPLFYLNVNRVYQPYVQSIKVSALGHHSMQLNQIWLDK